MIANVNYRWLAFQGSPWLIWLKAWVTVAWQPSIILEFYHMQLRAGGDTTFYLIPWKVYPLKDFFPFCWKMLTFLGSNWYSLAKNINLYRLWKMNLPGLAHSWWNASIGSRWQYRRKLKLWEVPCWPPIFWWSTIMFNEKPFLFRRLILTSKLLLFFSDHIKWTEGLIGASAE